VKVLFTGGGTGGHFYPIIAVAEGIKDVVHDRKLVEPELYYAAPDPYDKELLFQNNITFLKTPAGKVRRYFSFWNFTDLFKTAWGIIWSCWNLFFLYPDVILGTGGYGSFPMLFAARIYRIPVIIYSTDAEPSRVNKWAGKFAAKVAISFPESAKFFKEEKVAHTGNPIRKALLIPARDGAHEFLKLEPSIPVILVLGGSQGAMSLNDTILAALSQLVEKYQVVHQTGEAHFVEVEGRAKVALANSPYANRYRCYGYLNELAQRMSAGVAKIVISRAGAGSIFEIAAWGIPSILIPIPEDISHDQTKNAFAYASAGAATVIEQNNLTPGVLISEINRILTNPDLSRTMGNAARAYARVDAARTIAEAILSIALSHEPV
jgi:UDP-N-acetylglucosamine--N-acetylmuramyl-(pentapeptide) pyrophosphoryl-undecaprenol N-acetylglucosamine transferase